MTAPQLKVLLRWAIRYMDRENQINRRVYTNPRTGGIEPRSVALAVAKTDMWLSRARKAVARPRAARKAK